MANVLEQRADGSIALFINSDLQFDSNDERIYHEALALPALAVANRRLQSQLKVLVIGGGDGLIAREFFKSSAVASLDLVDYDPEILDIARQDIADLNNRSLFDPRITTHVQDAWKFVDQALANNIVYDLIVSDLTGAVDATAAPFQSIEWYSKLSRLLRHNGVLSVNALSAQRTPEAYWSIFNSIAKANLHARPYHVHIPSFAALGYGQDWGFFIASREPITIEEMDDNLELAQPRNFLKTVDDLRQLFVFPEEILAYQPKSLPALFGSNVLLQYFFNPTPCETYSGITANSLAVDFGNAFIPEADTGKDILPPELRSMLAESVYQTKELSYAQDPQLLLHNILELMPSLQREHTPELIADFLENPAAFLEAIDLPGLVARLLKRAAELPAQVVTELELLRDKLQEWAGDHLLLLSLGQRVITILTLVIVIGNLLYPDVVYGKGEAGHHAGGHHAPAAGAGRGRGDDRGRDNGRGRRGGTGWVGGGTTYYNNYRQPGTVNVYRRNVINEQPIQGPRHINQGGQKAPDTVGYTRDLDPTRLISPDVYLTEDGKYLAVRTEGDQIIYMDGENWYSDRGSMPLDQPYPDNFKAILISHLSSLVREGVASQNRLLKTKAEFVSYAEMLTQELGQFNLTADSQVNYGSHSLPLAEAIRRTQSTLKMLASKIDVLDKQIEELPPRINLAKIALTNLTVQES